MWQDYVLTAANLVLMVGMCPMVLKRVEVPLETSIPTAVALTTFSIVYLTLGLVATSIASGISAGLWLILMVSHPSINKTTPKRRRKVVR